MSRCEVHHLNISTTNYNELGGDYFCPESCVTRAETAGLFEKTFNLP